MPHSTVSANIATVAQAELIAHIDRQADAIAPEPFDRTPAQVIAAYDQDLRDRSSKLIEASSFLAVLQEELETGSLQLTGNPGVLDYAMQRLQELTA